MKQYAIGRPLAAASFRVHGLLRGGKADLQRGCSFLRIGGQAWVEARLMLHQHRSAFSIQLNLVHDAPHPAALQMPQHAICSQRLGSSCQHAPELFCPLVLQKLMRSFQLGANAGACWANNVILSTSLSSSENGLMSLLFARCHLFHNSI